MKKSTFFERLSQVIEYYGIKNINSFAKDYLKYRSSEKINRLRDESKRPSFEILEDISNKFVDIDMNWLITGRGEMLKNVDINGEINQINGDNNIAGNVINRSKVSVNSEKDSIIKSQLEQIGDLIEIINKLTTGE
jgi:predicted ATP-grasp superfamily ATP-dependent carboligase